MDLDILASCTESDTLPVLAAVTKEYRALLTEENALDFPLIQTMTWELLKDEFVLNELRQKIQYIMVDEYQDTNRIQEQILLKLAAPRNRICVVGDDDQALYRFRGATVENILRFAENFSAGTCKKVTLSRNFRSHKDIIEFYNKYMKTPWLTPDNLAKYYARSMNFIVQQWIESGMSVPPEEIAAFVREIASAVEFAPVPAIWSFSQ